jgi:hypothetical protein
LTLCFLPLLADVFELTFSSSFAVAAAGELAPAYVVAAMVGAVAEGLAAA